MTGLLRRVVLGLAAVGLCWTTGCAGFWVAQSASDGTTGTGSTDNVYIANAESTTNLPTLSGFTVGTGTLTAVPSSPYSLPCTPSAEAVNPADTLLFVSCSTNIDIYAYAINSDGSLTVLNGGAAIAPTTPTLGAAVSMVVSPDGQWLLALDATSTAATVDEYGIDLSSGTLVLNQMTGASAANTNLNTTIVPTGIAFATAPSGDYVITSLGTAGDMIFAFDTSTGVFPSTPSQLSLGSSDDSDNAVAVNPAGTYLFIARSGPGGGLAVYSINSGGVLGLVNNGTPYTAETQTLSKPDSVVINTAGTDVYVANRLEGNIYGFSINASNGALTALNGSPYTSGLGTDVAALAVDNSGSYLMAASNGGSPDLTLYSFDTTTAGKLDFATSIATGTDPAYPVAIAATH